MVESYQQPEKVAVRNRLLSAAVQALTVDRHKACLVREDELIPTVEFFLASLRSVKGLGNVGDATYAELAEWLGFHTLQVGKKEPQSLRVLYLCGPEPLNDLEVMLRLGINPHNVWAVTDKRDHQAAIDACAAENVPLKVHCGKLAEFFDTFNETFDIIYFDACGPFTGGDPNTLGPIISILERQRLQSPGVLITNFSEPPTGVSSRARYIDIVTAFFSSRYNDLPQFVHDTGPDPEEFQHDHASLQRFAESHLEQLYSEFITRMLVDIGMSLLPNCRALAMGALFRGYLAGEKELSEAQERANKFEIDLDRGLLPGDMVLSPSSYPLVSFVRNLELVRPRDPILTILSKPLDRQTRSLRMLVEASSMLDRVIEGHWDMLSEVMQRAIAVSWFDRYLGVTCDEPLPNLVVNSLLGIYGRPWFANSRLCQRVAYKAKVHRMFCDLFVLDQCRSYYDWFPTVHSCSARFKSIPFQIVARCILDRIERHDARADTHPFRGAAVFGLNRHEVAKWYRFNNREDI